MPDAPPRIAQLSDTHIDPRRDEDLQRWTRIRDAVLATDPHLIVVSGDLSDDGFAHPPMFDRLAELLDELPQPKLVVPGNHDVGNRAGLNDAIRAEHLREWEQRFGPSFASTDLNGHRIVALNSQLIGSTLPAAREQEAFLSESLRDGAPTWVFTHMPFFLRAPDEAIEGRSAYWAPLPEDRDQYLHTLEQGDVRLVGTGHVHAHAVRQLGRITWAWCPPLSGLFVRDPHFPENDVSETGFLLHAARGESVRTRLVPVNIPLKQVDFADAKI